MKKNLKLDKVYLSEKYQENVKLKSDHLYKIRPSWIKVRLDKKVIFIKILVNGEAFWYRRYFKDYFFPLESTSEDYKNYYNFIAEEYESFIPQNKNIGNFLVSLFEKFKVNKKDNLLDVGAGTGLVSEIVAMSGYNNLTLLDISKKELDIAKRKIPLKTSAFQIKDLTKQEIDGKYDTVFETMSLDYFKDQELTTILKKIKDSLNKGGLFFAIDRHIPSEFGEIFKKIEEGKIALDTPEGNFDYYFFIGRNEA